MSLIRLLARVPAPSSIPPGRRPRSRPLSCLCPICFDAVDGWTRRENWSERAGVGTPVDQNILSGDIAGLHGTEECAGCAKFIGVPEPLGGIGHSDLFSDLADASRRILRQRCQVRFKAIGVEGAGQQIVDGYLVLGGGSRE